MADREEDLVVLPVAGTLHAHTGCFHVLCPLPGGCELWLLGGAPYPRLLGDRPALPPGGVLAGFLRRAGADSEELQGRLEQSGLLAGLAVEWVEVGLPGMRR